MPAIADRVAQTVAAARVERVTEQFFHRDSCGYRPGRGARDALAVTRRRCRAYDWVIDLDAGKFFDSVPRDLVVKAVERPDLPPWVLLYVRRWLAAPVVMPDGEVWARDQGTPQGSLCSAEHNGPYEQCGIMRSVVLLSLVRAMTGIDRCA